MNAIEPSVLLVDDEPNVLASLRRLLRLDRYRVLTAPNAAAALEFLEKERVAVIISDERMPGITGTELLRQVQTLYPGTIRMMLSGYKNSQSVAQLLQSGVIHYFIAKPWDNEVFRNDVQSAVERHRAGSGRRECA